MDVVKWESPLAYADWVAIVLHPNKRANTSFLKECYAQEWNPKACAAMMESRGLFLARGRSKVKLDDDAVQRRIAQAVWRECSRLLLRQMTSTARAFVIATQERAQKAAGISIEGLD